MTTMTYKSYVAIVEFDEDADIFHDEVINARRQATIQRISSLPAVLRWP